MTTKQKMPKIIIKEKEAKNYIQQSKPRDNCPLYKAQNQLKLEDPATPNFKGE